MNDTPIPFIFIALFVAIAIFGLGYWSGHSQATLTFKELGCEIEHTLKRVK